MKMHPHIVCLEECHCPIPAFPFPHTYKGYEFSTRADVANRLQDATIAITTIIPITPEDLDQCPNLKCVYSMATGVEWLNKDEFRKRGITAINAPQSNIATVSEHAIALYFASRRKIVELHNRTMRSDEYAAKGTLTHYYGGYPRTSSSETMTIVGYGHLGKKIESVAKALGMTVLVAERKGMKQREGRVSFEAGLEFGTVVVVTVPKQAETINMLDEKELRSMRKDSILINVSRGGIINETALVKALREGWIGGAATDVFEVEPPLRGVSPLLDESIPNLTVSPHIAWYSKETIQQLQDLLIAGLDGYVNGRPVNVIVKG